MRIAFLLGSSGISGGTNVILEYASRLQKQGDDVFLITLTPVDNKQLFWHKAAGSVNWIIFDEARSVSFDIVLATWWQSVYLLEQLKAMSYCYFVQSIESRFFPHQKKDNLLNRDINVLRGWCEDTYTFPLPVITEAQWICDYLSNEFGRNTALVRNGIRKDIYSREGKRLAKKETGRLRVLVEGPLNVFFKNVEKTIELCLQSDADEIWLLTSTEISEYPGVDKCFSRVAIEKTPEIYRSCDVLVKLSYVEGMFGPPLEMFHCGGTAIVYDVTGHDEYIKHKENAVVIEKDDEAAVVEWINRLKTDTTLLGSLCHEALRTASDWPDWQEQATLFSKQIKHIAVTTTICQETIARYTAKAGTARDNFFKSREYDRQHDRESKCGICSEHQNFVQVYYHYGEGYGNEAILWDSYHDSGWRVCSVILPDDKRPVTIRLDPSVRIGVVTIRSLRLLNVTTGNVLECWDSQTGFETLQLHGTCQQIENKKTLKIFAYGEDPQIHFPGTFIISGDRIELKIELFEEGVCSALRVLSENPVKRSLKKIASFLRVGM